MFFFSGSSEGMLGGIDAPVLLSGISTADPEDAGFGSAGLSDLGQARALTTLAGCFRQDLCDLKERIHIIEEGSSSVCKKIPFRGARLGLREHVCQGLAEKQIIMSACVRLFMYTRIFQATLEAAM